MVTCNYLLMTSVTGRCMNMKHWWNDTDRRSHKDSQKSVAVPLCDATNSTRTGLAIKPGICGVRPATDRLRHGNAALFISWCYLAKNNICASVTGLPFEHARLLYTFLHLSEQRTEYRSQAVVEIRTPQTTRGTCALTTTAIVHQWKVAATVRNIHCPVHCNLQHIRVRSQWGW